MPVIDEECRRCGKPLKFGARITTKWCSVSCRVMAYQQRRRTRADTLARIDASRPAVPPPDDRPRIERQLEAYLAARPDDQPHVARPFDVFDLDPEPWPGFSGSTR